LHYDIRQIELRQLTLVDMLGLMEIVNYAGRHFSFGNLGVIGLYWLSDEAK
tara:strand:+ start:511 stop:663 length:153 start_codon:yes stop_codon:yes gene_type:complete